jgi:hypothetical protein
LADVDVLLFDIQDVGVRFYTYIGTLHYVMESLLPRNGKKVVVSGPPRTRTVILCGWPGAGPGVHVPIVGMHPVPHGPWNDGRRIRHE